MKLSPQGKGNSEQAIVLCLQRLDHQVFEAWAGEARTQKYLQHPFVFVFLSTTQEQNDFTPPKRVIMTAVHDSPSFHVPLRRTHPQLT